MLRPCELGVRSLFATHPRPRWTAPAVIAGVAFLLAGCSAEFMRFDSPVFSLNGDPAGTESGIASAPLNDDRYDRRSDAAAGPVGDTYNERAPIQRIASAPAIPEAPASRNVERPRPSDDLPATSYAPLSTGALGADGEVTVSPGDTLYQISRRHGVTVAALREANGLTGNVIQPGQRLRLPGAGSGRAPSTIATPRTDYARPEQSYRAPSSRQTRAPVSGDSYTVRPGDSLYAISRRTNVSVAELKRLNGITDVRTLRPGARLALGRGSGAETTVVASRTDEQVPGTIRAKSIRTLPISRTESAGRAVESTVRQPTILNQRPSEPITTKPKQDVAMVAPTAPEQQFRWPAKGRIIAAFNHSGQGVKNDGVNISLPLGTDIQAAESGVVAYAGSELAGYGNLVLVRHDNGWVTAYAHADALLVKRNDKVERGQVIAKAGRTGDVTQPQLHFELRKGAKPVDPMPHMGPM